MSKKHISPMTVEQKGKLIAEIIRTMRAVAGIQRKAFNEGDTFFALAFKSDDELRRIAALVLGQQVQS